MVLYKVARLTFAPRCFMRSKQRVYIEMAALDIDLFEHRKTLWRLAVASFCQECFQPLPHFVQQSW